MYDGAVLRKSKTFNIGLTNHQKNKWIWGDILLFSTIILDQIPLKEVLPIFHLLSQTIIN